MALPTLDAVFASAANVPRRYMLAQWLVNELGSGSVADYITLPERYLWAKIAIAAGAPKDEAFYINAPKQYAWKDIYDAVSGSSLGTIDWVEKQALGHIAAAYRGDTGTPENLATYINWPWRYQVASIIVHTATDSDVLAFVTASGATDVAGLDAFVKGIKDLGLWDSMVAWPLRSSQNAGTGTTAYSLGGLGIYNGTLVNGPTWGADGILFDAASNTHITTTLDVQNLRKFTALVATEQRAQVGSSDSMIAAWNSVTAASQYFIMRKTATTIINGIVRSGAATRSLPIAGQSANWRLYGWGTQGSNTVLTTGGTQIVSQAFLPDETGSQTLNIGILSKPNNAPYDGKIALAMFYKDSEITTAQQLSVYNLYKQTLGIGLGLS
jgi:hypothetical protein